jgi:hypothetical protein
MHGRLARLLSGLPRLSEHVHAAHVAGGDVAIAVGYSTCATQVLDGPAIWTATITDGRVAHWRVYQDTPWVRRELNLT